MEPARHSRATELAAALSLKIKAILESFESALRALPGAVGEPAPAPLAEVLDVPSLRELLPLALELAGEVEGALPEEASQLRRFVFQAEAQLAQAVPQ